jgi:hypothetical protein
VFSSNEAVGMGVVNKNAEPVKRKQVEELKARNVKWGSVMRSRRWLAETRTGVIKRRDIKAFGFRPLF